MLNPYQKKKIFNDVEFLSEEENIGSQMPDTDQILEAKILTMMLNLYRKKAMSGTDNDDTFTTNTEINTGRQEYFDYDQHLNIIGFHSIPNKEVVFMVQRFQVVAYHLNSTKIQYLGNSRPKYCCRSRPTAPPGLHAAPSSTRRAS
jgi:hypothetical protein